MYTESVLKYAILQIAKRWSSSSSLFSLFFSPSSYFLPLNAVSSLVVRRHTRWNCNARTYKQWCEAFAPETATSQGEAPPCVPLHHLKRNCSLARHSSDDEIYLPRASGSSDPLARHSSETRSTYAKNVRRCALWSRLFAPRLRP